MDWRARQVAKRVDCELGGGDVGGEVNSAAAL